jgi:hypothetical protein
MRLISANWPPAAASPAARVAIEVLSMSMLVPLHVAGPKVAGAHVIVGFGDVFR